MKKFLIVFFLFSTSTVVFAKTTNKITNEDLVQKVNAVINSNNAKINELNKQYDEYVSKQTTLINNLREEKLKADRMWSECDERESWAWLYKSPCSHLIGKTTLLKTKSGLVVADDTYALNKCLAKLPNKIEKKVCQKERAKCQDYEKKLEFEENNLTTFKENYKRETTDIKNNTKNYKQEIYSECLKAFPYKNMLLDYCSNLKP